MDEGLVTAARVAEVLGVDEERVSEWARAGRVPFQIRGARGRRLYSIDDVRKAIGGLSFFNGRAYRAGTYRGRRAAERASGLSVFTCTGCEQARPVEDFSPARIRQGTYSNCRECRSADRDRLTDEYILKLLTRRTKLRAADVPPEMVEAKRAAMMVQRLVAPRPKRRTDVDE